MRPVVLLGLLTSTVCASALVACSSSSPGPSSTPAPTGADVHEPTGTVSSAAEAVGLTARPSNTTCVAPARPSTGPQTVALSTAFGGRTFQQPIGAFQAPGDSSRWYVVEKGGLVKSFTSASATTRTFADVTSLVNAGPNEAGLLGFAFHPDWSTNHQAFLSYTASSASAASGLRSIIARFESTDGGLTLDPTADELLTFAQPYSNHNGGCIAFGPDGHLYASFGDGGSAGDPGNRAQNLGVLLGKMLRLDVDGGTPYAVPSDNPFVSRSGARGEIFAYGLRNTWRFSFDRGTGQLWAGDVGQNAYEEVDVITSGGNYGWKVREGNDCYNAATCSNTGFVAPVAVYSHSQGISITGGYVYRGTALPWLVGRYVYGDFGSGRIWGLFPDTSGTLTPRLLLESGKSIASFAEGADGELYVLDYASGQGSKIVAGPGSSGGTFPQTLRATGCVDPQDATQPAAGVVPYDVNAPLWSDGATKDRFVAIPNGTTITVGTDGDLTLPAGSVAMKTFSLGGQPVETRLFVRHSDGGWAGYTYEWNAAGTDATLLENGKTKVVNGQTWTFPSRAECMQCHTGAAGFTLGLELGQLNRSFTYGPSRTANQLATWNHIGWFRTALTGPSSSQPRLASYGGSDPLEDQARAYLHANCSGCHRPGSNGGGPADLRASRTLAQSALCGASPTAGSVNGAQVLLSPGDPAGSILLQRMLATGTGTGSATMPPLGRKVVDSQGVQLVEDWIASLPTTCP